MPRDDVVLKGGQGRWAMIDLHLGAPKAGPLPHPPRTQPTQFTSPNRLLTTNRQPPTHHHLST